MKSVLLTLVTIISFSLLSIAQNVNIPDSKFKTKLLANKSLNKDANKLEISIKEANDFADSLKLSSLEIESLVGIEAFTHLKYLDCNSNQLTTLDLSKNIALISFDCSYNKIEKLTLPSTDALIEFFCTDNALTELNVSKVPKLQSIQCGSNQLVTLDVSNHYELTSLDCEKNELTSLNILGCMELSNCICIFNDNLNCIKAPAKLEKGDWIKDAHMTFSETCK